jgi:hypothetical protein
MLQRTAKSCGPDAPTLASSSRRFGRPYRAQANHIRGRRWQNSPVTGESAKEPVKTIACGNAGRFRCTRCYSCAFYHYKCTRGRGCSGHPAFPAPSKGAEDKCTARAHRAAGPRTHVLICRHCEARLVRRSSTSEVGSDEAIILRHSGAMPTGPRNARPDDRLRIEPGISRFRVWSCGPSRNDGA